MSREPTRAFFASRMLLVIAALFAGFCPPAATADGTDIRVGLPGTIPYRQATVTVIAPSGTFHGAAALVRETTGTWTAVFDSESFPQGD
ncbi:MAG: hypothetical protein KDD44_06080, partial [Bdellovibrionales bacterium]|nr:hypothetical protein [Bdellovibrionales bacterium]